ncbi:MAG: hypothetical protein ACRYF5_17990 [Janthinobacterium lividum]
MNAISRLLRCRINANRAALPGQATPAPSTRVPAPRAKWSLTLSVGTIAALMVCAGPSTSVEISTTATQQGTAANGAQPFSVNPNGSLSTAGVQVSPSALLPGLPNPASDADDLRHHFDGAASAKGSAGNLGTMQGATGTFVVPGKKINRPGVFNSQLGKAPANAGTNANSGNAVTLAVDDGGLLNVQVDKGALDTMASNRNLLNLENGQVLMSNGVRENLLASAINSSGTSEARGVVYRNGKMVLTAAGASNNSAGATANTLASAAVSASGGNIASASVSPSAGNVASAAAGPSSSAFAGAGSGSATGSAANTVATATSAPALYSSAPAVLAQAATASAGAAAPGGSAQGVGTASGPRTPAAQPTQAAVPKAAAVPAQTVKRPAPAGNPAAHAQSSRKSAAAKGKIQAARAGVRAHAKAAARGQRSAANMGKTGKTAKLGKPRKSVVGNIHHVSRTSLAKRQQQLQRSRQQARKHAQHAGKQGQQAAHRSVKRSRQSKLLYLNRHAADRRKHVHCAPARRCLKPSTRPLAAARSS